MENGSLANVIKKFGSLTESLTAIYVTQVLRGLKYLHDQGVLHRDIKGANILTSKDGYVIFCCYISFALYRDWKIFASAHNELPSHTCATSNTAW